MGNEIIKFSLIFSPAVISYYLSYLQIHLVSDSGLTSTITQVSVSTVLFGVLGLIPAITDFPERHAGTREHTR